MSRKILINCLEAHTKVIDPRPRGPLVTISHCVNLDNQQYLIPFKGWMIQKLGEKTPNFLRVYGRSIEAMDYPIPGRTFLSRRSTHNLKGNFKVLVQSSKNVDKKYKQN